MFGIATACVSQFVISSFLKEERSTKLRIDKWVHKGLFKWCVHEILNISNEMAHCLSQIKRVLLYCEVPIQQLGASHHCSQAFQLILDQSLSTFIAQHSFYCSWYCTQKPRNNKTWNDSCSTIDALTLYWKVNLSRCLTIIFCFVCLRKLSVASLL